MGGKQFWLAALMVTAFGCGEAPIDNEPDVVDDVTKADAVYPSGTYENQHPSVGELAELTLNPDHTFSRKFQMVDCIPAIACGPERGTYKFTHSSTTKYIRFYDYDGTFLDKYSYKLYTNSITLRDSNNYFSMEKSKYAGLGEHCGGFVFQPKECAPGLECVYTGVPDVPGTCQDPKANPCVQAGGSCVALYPGTCPNGVTGGYSCGGGLGVTCCMPSN
jgi:hypothetical protein